MDVSKAILDADFQKHHGFSVDVKLHRLLDTLTHLKVQGIASLISRHSEGGKAAEGKEHLVSTAYACVVSLGIPPPPVTFVYAWKKARSLGTFAGIACETQLNLELPFPVPPHGVCIAGRCRQAACHGCPLVAQQF